MQRRFSLSLITILFFYFCVFFAVRAEIDFYYPQWQDIALPADDLPFGRIGATCTRVVDLSLDQFAAETADSTTFPSPKPADDVTIDSLICFGGLSRRLVPDHSFLPETGDLVIGNNVHHTFVMNDINLFDIQGNRWYALNVGNATTRTIDDPYFYNDHPDGRSNAASAFHNGQFIVWGGSSPQEILDSNVLVYTLANNSWTSFDYVAGKTAPHTRTHFSSVQYDKYLYIFGGEWFLPFPPNTTDPITGKLQTNMPPYFNDLWRLDLESFVWTRLNPQNPLPTARASHSAVVTSSGKMYVWGGQGYGQCPGVPYFAQCLGATTFEKQVLVMDLLATPLVWQTLTFDTVYPPFREYHAMSLGIDEQSFVVVGGTTNNFFFTDLYTFSLANQTWTLISSAYPAVDARYGHVIVPIVNTTVGRENDDPRLFGNLFLMLMGRRFTYDDVATAGILFAGGYVQIDPPEGLIVGETDTLVISFDRKSPTQQLIPKDNCGQQLKDSAINLAFTTVTERSAIGNSIIQQVDFQHNLYEVNASALVQTNPAIGFTLNNSAIGLSVGFDFTLFGESSLVNYGNTSFTVPPSTNKWSFNIGGWNFISTGNTLEIAVGMSVVGGQRFTQVFESALPAEEQRVKYTFVSPTVTVTVYIAKFALVAMDPNDPTVLTSVTVGHRIDLSSAFPTLIFILPYFQGALYYDPDFGVTLDTDTASACEETIFDGWKIAVIVVTVIVPLTICCIVCVIVIIITIIRRYRAHKVNAAELEMVDFEVADSTRDDVGSIDF